MKCKESFNALPWHDAILLALKVDRSSPGKNDTVALLIEWPDGSENHVVFENCYFLETRMNFGIVAPESVLAAECLTDSEHLLRVRGVWKHLLESLDQLHEFRIRTNSTNSSLTICANSYRIVKEVN